MPPRSRRPLWWYLQREYRAGGFRTRREFAQYLGVSLSTLDNIEAGVRRPSARTISALELALSWEAGSVVSVAAGGKPQRVEDVELDKLLRAWRQLPVEARRMLATLAEQAVRDDVTVAGQPPKH